MVETGNLSIIFSLLGTLLAVAALVVALYNTRKQRKFEDQMEKKQELKELGGIVGDITDIRELFIEPFQDYTRHVDLEGEMRMIAREVLATHHSTGEPVTVAIREIHEGTGDDELEINTPESALEAIKNNRYIFFKIAILESSNRVSYSATDFIIHKFSFMYKDLEQIERNYSELLSEFEPILTDELEELSDEILLQYFDWLLSLTEGQIFDPEEFETTEELEEAIFQEFICYPGMMEDLKKLDEVIDRAENTRKNIVQTSYS